MEGEWELSKSVVSLDGQGIRGAGVLPILSIMAGKIVSTSSETNENDGTQEDMSMDSQVTASNELFTDDYRIILGSQGGNLCEYHIPSGLSGDPIPFRHDHSITAVLPMNSGLYYCTGCKDSVIRIFDSTTHAVVQSLHGHEKAVTSLSWGVTKRNGQLEPDCYLISGSWDGTAKVWERKNGNLYSLLATLPGHENSVCVTGLDCHASDPSKLLVATGSAGIAHNNVVSQHTIRIWEVDVSGHYNTPIIVGQISNDHDGPIRDISFSSRSIDSTPLIATCSNDGTVRIRNATTGVSLCSLAFINPDQQDHPSMLLSVKFVGCSDEYIVAGTDDGDVAIWCRDVTLGGMDYKQCQVISHLQTVWSIVSLPTGDFGTCCQDGTLRIFTRNKERMAPIEERKAFVDSIQSGRAAKETGPSAEEIAKLPQWDTNSRIMGKSEGQVHLFQRNNIAIAAQWSAASQTWIEVGEVMGRPLGPNASGTTDDNMIDGQRYDHVFPIEVDGAGGTVVSLQIGYNIGENQFSAAQRFIDAHQLPQYHLSQIADYIQQRTGTQSLAARTLGSNSTVPLPMASTGIPIASYEYIPSKKYKSFDLPPKNVATTFEKMKKKIIEFNLLPTEPMKESIDSLIATLISTNRYHSSVVPDDQIMSVAALMNPKLVSLSIVFPGLDLARLLVLHPHASSIDRSNVWKDTFIPYALELCQTMKSCTVEGPASTAVPMLSLRLFANSFAGGPGSKMAATEHIDSILDCMQLYLTSGNKNVRLSIATCIHNICYYLYTIAVTGSKSDAQEGLMIDKIVPLVVPLINAIIDSKIYETEALHQVLIGLGTLLLCSPLAKESAKSLYLGSKVEPAASPHNESCKVTAKEIYSLLA